MTQVLGGPGNPLPPPQALYPYGLLPPAFQSNNVATNNITLAPGQALPIPAGFFMVTLDAYALFQWKDPVTTTWKGLTGPTAGAPFMVRSDGVNFRLANLNQTPVSATVTAAGTGYPVGATSVTASGAGGSQWVAVVGGIVNSTVSITAAGSGYGIPPLVMVPAPPSPGVEATMHAVISGGSVTSIIVDVVGAGYNIAPPISILVDPFDPNFLAGNAIVNATAVATLTGAGTIGAVLNLNPGAAVASAPTLTITGTGGSGATATATMQSSLASISSPFIQPI